MVQTFLEHYQPPYTAVTILKGMDCFKTMMKVKDILKSHNHLALIRLQQFTKMVCCLNDIVYPYSLIRNTYCICLENVTGLLLCQSATLDMV